MANECLAPTYDIKCGEGGIASQKTVDRVGAGCQELTKKARIYF